MKQKLLPLFLLLSISINMQGFGNYPTASGAEAQHYNINYVAGTLTIEDNNPNTIITFADSKVKAICVANWDTNGDKELSMAEAAAVKDIGEMFRGNKNLESLNELQYFTGLTNIPAAAFYECESLKSIKLPKTIISIGNYAFQYCRQLTSLTIPASVTSIGAYEFSYCNSLAELIVEEGNTIYDSRDNCNAIIKTANNTLIAGCKNTRIPEGVTMTNSDAFYGIESLTSIQIPATVSYINSGLFAYCKNLASITVAEDNTVYDSRGNCNAIIKKETNEIVEGCKNTIIPNNVVSIGYYAFAGRASGQITIPGNIKKIGNLAFTGCRDLKTVVMEEGVKEIGKSAFSSCDLETIVLPSTVTTINSDAFQMNSNVKSITSKISKPYEIPTDVFSYYCYKNATLYVPTGTKALYEQTTGWQDFENIVEIITFADSKVKAICVANWDTNGDKELSMAEAAAVKDIGEMFRGNKNLESLNELQYFTGLTNIPAAAFYECESLKSIKLPKTIISIGNYAFQYCRQLTSLTIPASVTSIGAYEFSYCNSLAELIVEEGNTIYDSRDNCNAIIKTANNTLIAGCKNTRIPEGVTMTNSDAFYGIESLTSIQIPATVSYINSGLFAYCKNLASITVAEDNTVYDSRGNCNAIIKKETNEIVEGCKNTIIPNNVVSIGYYAFAGRASGQITIPGNIKKIGNLAFTGCRDLKTVVMEEGVKEIGKSAFSSCDLETIVLPSTVTTINSDAFQMNSNVKSITSKISKPYEIPTDVFSYYCYKNATLYVPTGTKALYEQTTGWQDFENIVEIITFADSKVKAICVANWDTDSDGQLSKTEAAAVTSLGDVFMGNSEITSFDELQYFTGLTTIPDYAFSGCGSLKSIRLPKSLTSIGEYAFEDCTSLETVVSFIETPFELGEGAFCAWENDRHKFDLHFSLYVPIGTKELYRAAGWDVDENHGDYRTILSGTPENPGSFTVDGIVYDPIDATTVELIDGKNASGDVTIPSMVANGKVSYQVTEIGACAFKGNTSLTSIVIPNSIKAIRPFAFNGCTGLTTVISYIETPFYLGLFKGVFLNNENVVLATYLQLTLYVPAGTKSLYEQASWTDASRIVEVGGDAYAVFDSTTGTLTFKCGEKPSGDNVYDAEDTGYNPGWQEHRANLKKVEFDKSFAFARPMSTYSWFKYTDGIEEDDPLTEIVGLQYLNTSNVTDMGSMFYGCNGLTSLNVSNFDTSKAENMYFMFGGCKNLSAIDLSNFDTGNVTNMSCMFSSCSGLTSLDLSGFNTSNVTNMSGMFGHCTGLVSLDLSNFNTNKVTDMSTMFRFCRSLTILDLHHFDTSNVTNMYWMFYYSNMSRIYVSDRWSTEKVTNGSEMFYLCANLVGGQGTKYDYNHSDYTYAHIDGGADNPGYFTSAGKLGDANDDGYVNMTDVNAVKDYIMKGKTEGFIIENADMNGDNEINAADIVKILNIIKSIGN